MEWWQTTNQQPWVEAVLSGRTSVKTRTSKPVVPNGAIVLLHASKSMWPDWHELRWAKGLRPDDLGLGMILGVARVVGKGPSEILLLPKERRIFDVSWGNCAAYWGVKFDYVYRLLHPVPTRGFQVPYCRAKPETVEAILRANPDVSGLSWMKAAS